MKITAWLAVAATFAALGACGSSNHNAGVPSLPGAGGGSATGSGAGAPSTGASQIAI
jgi:hypothetical protein